MTATTLNLIEQVSSKKKKLNKSKNRKKTWRKHIDLTGIEAALEQQEEDERLGCLGEVTSNFMYLDTGDGAADSTKENRPEDDQTAKKKLPTLRLEYTVDPKTGLKATDRPKSDKLIPELQLLAGLPGSKGPFKQSRFREKDTFLHQVQQKTRHSKNRRTAHKALVKAANSFSTTKSSRKIIKSKQKLSFDKNLWSEAPAPSREDELSAEAITHMKLSLGQQPINNRSSKIKCKNIPAVPLPHPGLSYNPDLGSHQKLLAKAVKSEMSRSKQAKYTNDMRTCDYPKGAEIVDNIETIRDMEGVHANTPAIKEEPMEDEDEASVPAEARKMDRRTHAQRLKYRRHHEALRLAKHLKDKKKRENAILRAAEIQRELDEEDAKKQRVAEKKARAQRKKALKPPKTFVESKDVEVALSSELRDNLRCVQPTSNPVLERYTHLYRRGLLYSNARTRVYQRKGAINSMRKVVNRPGYERLTEKDFEGPHDVTARPLKRAPKKKL
ncbi:ribosome biogenesis protein NOP53 [Hyalella azteca]|uniref:Ribosome biogenesis protein NOP53 n=1 Tax=Hyalella azteca TaxID=294128 RepID=A0A8B7N3L8_HYAAZ|nr:ribosome biogenesis protein NOP53 [Hyalella azteca]